MGDREAGFAAIDALVGLTILAAALALAMGAAATSVRLGTRARQLQAVQNQLVLLAESTPIVPGERSGETAGLAWTTRVTAENDAHGLCRLDARVGLAAGKKLFILSTLRPCAGSPA